jgi:hypothetical protein
VYKISKFLAMKPLTVNQTFLTENALKLAYSNVEFQNFPRGGPKTPRRSNLTGGEGRMEERRGVEWEGDGEIGREGLKEGKGCKEEKKEKGRGEEFETPQMFQTDRRHCIHK